MNILLFARLRDELGQDSIELDLPEPVQIADIRAALQQRWPQHQNLLASGRALVAVNQTLINNDQQLVSRRDEVAFFPPMTGG